MKCYWCRKPRKSFSDWEQDHHKNGWQRLCKPCARLRLDNPYNALLPMRKVQEKDGGLHASDLRAGLVS